MKRLTLIALGLVLAASIASAQTQVLSRNAVGYTKLTIPAGKYNLVRLDFNSLDGNPVTVSNALGNQLPDGSRIAIWKPVEQSYTFLTRNRGAWQQGTTVMSRGMAVFLRGQTNVGDTNYDVFLMGEVPDRFTATNTLVGIVASGGLSFIGYSYPVATAFSNLTIATTLTNGSKVALWSIDAGYSIYTKNRGAWPAGLASNVIQPGQGFWVRTATGMDAFNWDEVKPYTWP